mgnify:CR=1 FL=1
MAEQMIKFENDSFEAWKAEHDRHAPTLRDRLAMAALQGLMQRGWSVIEDDLATEAYGLADAMLKAREQV